MTWFKMDDNWITHPKVQAAGVNGRALWIAGGLHCVKHLTDGRIDKTSIPVLAALSGVPATAAKKLVDCGLWHDEGDWYRMHDYADYQPSGADVKALRERKAQGAARGNHERWHASRKIIDPDCPFCVAGVSHMRSVSDSLMRSVSDQSTDTSAIPPDPTRPDPTRKPITPDVDCSLPTRALSVEAVIDHLTGIEYQTELDAGTAIKSPARYRRRITQRLTEQHGERITALIADAPPDATPAQIAHTALTAPQPIDHTICADCRGDGWNDTTSGLTPCPNTRATA